MPRPLSFFTWITALAVVILVAAPFSQPAPPPASKVFTAIINLVAGVAVIPLLSGWPALRYASARPSPRRGRTCSSSDPQAGPDGR
jgi:hypothetical protein